MPTISAPAPITLDDPVLDFGLADSGGTVVSRTVAGEHAVVTFEWRGVDTRRIDVFAAALVGRGWKVGEAFGPGSCAWQRFVAMPPTGRR